MPNIFEQVTGQTVTQGNGEPLIGPWWCNTDGCFEVDDEAIFFPETGYVVWTCEEGHKNKEKVNV